MVDVVIFVDDWCVFGEFVEVVDDCFGFVFDVVVVVGLVGVFGK